MLWFTQLYLNDNGKLITVSILGHDESAIKYINFKEIISPFSNHSNRIGLTFSWNRITLTYFGGCYRLYVMACVRHPYGNIQCPKHIKSHTLARVKVAGGKEPKPSEIKMLVIYKCAMRVSVNVY